MDTDNLDPNADLDPIRYKPSPLDTWAALAEIVECSRCGSVVGGSSRRTHDQWHSKIDK